MDKAITKAVLQDIANICKGTSCGDCPFDVEAGCPYMYAPEHWDAEQIVEYLED